MRSSNSVPRFRTIRLVSDALACAHWYDAALIWHRILGWAVAAAVLGLCDNLCPGDSVCVKVGPTKVSHDDLSSCPRSHKVLELEPVRRLSENSGEGSSLKMICLGA